MATPQEGEEHGMGTASSNGSSASKDGSEDILFSLRNTQCEYYMAPLDTLTRRHHSLYRPLLDDLPQDPHFRYRLPVIRIFGTTPMGQRACLHLHGALPYLFVRPEATGEGPLPDWTNLATFEELLPVLEQELEKAIHVDEQQQRDGNQQSGQQQQQQPGQQQQQQQRQRQQKPWKAIYKAELVRGTPLYGYHPREEYFVKIWLLDPKVMNRAASVLQSGVILKTRLQPHEAHIPFLLQLFVDLNLVGMGYIHLSNFHGNVRFRLPMPVVADYQHELEEEGGPRPSDDPTDVDVRFRLWLRRNTPAQYLEAAARGDGQQAPVAGGGGKGAGRSASLAQGASVLPPPPPPPPPPSETGKDREAMVAEVMKGLSWSQDLVWSQAPGRASDDHGNNHCEAQDHQQQQPSVEAGRQTSGAEWRGRMSTCELELDAHIVDVLNPRFRMREASKSGNLVNSLKELWEEEAARQCQSGDKPPNMSQLSLAAGEDPSKMASAFLEGAPKAIAHLISKARDERARNGHGDGKEDEVPMAQLSGSSQGLSQGSSLTGASGSSQHRRSYDEVAFTQQEEEQLRQVLTAAENDEEGAAAVVGVGVGAVEEGEEDEEYVDSIRELKDLDMTQQYENETYQRHFERTPVKVRPPGGGGGGSDAGTPEQQQKRKSPGLGSVGSGGSRKRPRTPSSSKSPHRQRDEDMLLQEARRVRFSGDDDALVSSSVPPASQGGSLPSTLSSSLSPSAASTPSRPVPLSHQALTKLQPSDLSVLRFHRHAPTSRELTATIWDVYRVLPVINQPLVFAKKEDLREERSRHRHHHHPSEAPEFDTGPTVTLAQRRLAGQPHHAPSMAIDCERCQALATRKPPVVQGRRILIPTRRPPSQREAMAWLAKEGDKESRRKNRGRAGSSSDEGSEEEDDDDDEGGSVRFAANPQGVLGAGGRLDGAGLKTDKKKDKVVVVEAAAAGGAAVPRVHLVADPNTGKLVPTTVTAPTSMPPPASRAGGGGGGGGGGHQSYVSKLVSQISPPTQTPLTHVPGSGERGLRRIYPQPVRVGRLIRHSEGNRHTVMCLEVHVQTRKELLPDPKLDPVVALIYVVRDYRNWSSDHEDVTQTMGVVVAGDALSYMWAGTAAQKPPPQQTTPGMGSSGCTHQQQDGGGGGGGAKTGGGGGGGWCPVCKTKDVSRFCVCGSRQGGASNNGPAQAGNRGMPPPSRRPPPTADRARGPDRPSLIKGMSLGSSVEVEEVADEKKLFERFLHLVSKFDPDFLVGWELQQCSLGYLIDRHKVLYHSPQLSLVKLLSRLRPERERGVIHVGEEKEDEWGVEQQSGIWVLGRTVLNIWRLMKQELKLSIYTLPNVVAHVLGRRFPVIKTSALTADFAENPSSRSRVLGHVLLRARLGLDLLDQLDLIGRTSEMARLFGIDFFSVLNRGSQYRVEATMMRVLKPLNFIAISASRKQVSSQEALEHIPLVFEPQSGVYTDPVAVLDFQSLYPSMIIAYNLCFSTCLGRIKTSPCQTDGRGESHKGKLGFIPYPERQTAANLAYIEDKYGRHEALRCFISPSGAIFCTKRVRQGVLPRMLHEILQTRFMVKKAMKRAAYKDKPVLQRVLNARQFALKMIANVTYGYASASFSGRMPMAELADAIVSTARRTLTTGVKQVHTEPAWAPAQVVYGDTDSMFVWLRGRSCADAIRVGQDIAQKVTGENPQGVVLKFDKVYDTCVLATKKRYVGRAFEEVGGTGHFDAKGIEAVRRDQCPIVIKMQEKVLRILFTTRDLSQVKAYIVRQLTKMMEGRVRLQDFIFAKEVRMGTYASEPPAAIVAGKAMQLDPRAEPRKGERVPYVAVTGPPVTKLADLVVDPQKMLGPNADPGLRINFKYYIEKQVLPALQRVLLCDVDVSRWYQDMPRPAAPINTHYRGRQGPTAAVGGTMAITNFYRSIQCQYCRQTISRPAARRGDPQEHAHHAVCDDCMSDPTRAAAIAMTRRSKTEAKLRHLYRICQACCHAPAQPAWATRRPSNPSTTTVLGENVGDSCVSLECPVYYERCKAQDRLQGDIEDLMKSVIRPQSGEEDMEEQLQHGGGGDGEEEEDEEVLMVS